MRILIQFIGQGVGLILLKRKRTFVSIGYKMPLYPLPVLVAIAVWLFILYSKGMIMMLYGCIVISLGIIVYYIKAKWLNEWPYIAKQSSNNI